MQRHHLLGGFVQIARAAVVTQTTPQTQHLVFMRFCQIKHSWKTLHEAREVIAHRHHLGLLQHDF